MIIENLVPIKISLDPQTIGDKFVNFNITNLSSYFHEISDSPLLPKLKAPFVERVVKECVATKYSPISGNSWRIVDEDICLNDFECTKILTSNSNNDNYFKIGKYSLSYDLFYNSELKVHTFSLNNQHSFKTTFRVPGGKKNEKYLYLTDGVFYKAKDWKLFNILLETGTTRSSGEKTLSLIFKIALFFLTQSFFFSSYEAPLTTPQDKLDYIIDHCIEGDIMIYYEYFTPFKASVIGYKNNSTIITKDVNGFSFGSLTSKLTESSNIIPSMPIDFDSSLFKLLKILWPFLFFFFLVYLRVPKKRRIIILYFVTCIIGTVRSFLYPDNPITSRYWTAALLLGLCFYYIM